MTDLRAVSTDETRPEPELEHDSERGEEWDDTPTSLQLRALATVFVGALLLWSQSHSPIDTRANWMQWIWFQVVANLFLPLGIVWLFFAQTIRHQSYLRNQALNAWNYGWNFRDWKTDVKWALMMTTAMLPLLWFFSRQSSTRIFYANYFPSQNDVGFLALLLTIVVYMLCWEWFFRGFLLFGIAQAFSEKWAPFVAIPLQAALFGWAHSGKPAPEMYASFLGGTVLGIVAWRQKSWLAPFLTHALVHVIWAILVLKL